MWLRHRIGLTLVLLWFVAVCVAFSLWPGEPTHLAVDLLAILPFIVAFMYLIAVLSHGFDADISARRSGFPTRLFALPVSTGLLVVPLLLLGTASVAGGWLVLFALVVRLTAPELPYWGLAAMLAAVVAWSQALVWIPFRLPWLRVAGFAGGLAAVITTLAASERLGLGEGGAVLVLTPLVLVAYLVAWAGVVRARRGELPGWDVPTLPTLGIAAGRAFSSPMAGQMWRDWREFGLRFVMSVAIFFAVVLPCVMLLERVDREYTELGVVAPLAGLGVTASTTVKFFAVLFLVPLVLALGVGLRRARSDARRAPYSLDPYAATRPLADAAVAASRFTAAAWASVGASLVSLAVIAVWVVVGWKWADLDEVRTAWLPDHSVAGAVGLVLLAVVVSALLTWGRLTGGMLVGLTGRLWVVVTASTVVFTAAVVGGIGWVRLAREDPPAALAVLGWIAASLLALKGVAVVIAAGAVTRRRLLSLRTVARLVAVWVVAVLVLFAAAWWLLPAGIVSGSGLACTVILLVPFARLLAGPLAVAWDRHR